MSLLGRDTRGSESDAGLLASVYSISSDRQEVSARYDMIQGKKIKSEVYRYFEPFVQPGTFRNS